MIVWAGGGGTDRWWVWDLLQQCGQAVVVWSGGDVVGRWW